MLLSTINDHGINISLNVSKFPTVVKTYQYWYIFFSIEILNDLHIFDSNQRSWYYLNYIIEGVGTQKEEVTHELKKNSFLIEYKQI